MAELNMTAQLTRFLVVLRANMTHVREKLGIFVKHDVIVHSSCRLRLVLADPTLKLITTMNFFEMFVLHFSLVEDFMTQVAFE